MTAGKTDAGQVQIAPLAAMPPTKSSPAKALRKVTLAGVAALAHVSIVTASYALRNNPKISAATRARVHRAAKKLRYVPNPELGRLMQLLRMGRPVGQQATIALLSVDAQRNVERNHYFNTLVEGVKTRCEEIGYSLDPLVFAPGEMTSKRLTHVLRSRGIQGILIPPMRQPFDFSGVADWDQFSVVAATYTAQNMKVNRVVPNHLQVAFLALDKLEKLGYKRIGLVTEPNDHARVSHAFLAALALHQQSGRSTAIPALQLSEPSVMHQWIRTHRPDVILTTELHLGRLIAKMCANSKSSHLPIILLNNPRDPTFDGVYQHPEIVGRRAVDLLASQIQLGARGDPEHPNVLMVEGSWLERALF